MINDMFAREIAAQPGVLADCVQPLTDAVRKMPRPAGRIFAGGCGDSAFAPYALGGVFDALGLEIEPKTAMELAGFVRLRESDTVILSSISGGTKRTVEAAAVAKAKGARVIALTCNRGSALDLAADETIVLPFKSLSRKTPHTLDYAVTLLALTQLTLHWQGFSPEDAAEVVTRIPELLADTKKQATEIAAAMTPAGRIVLLGAGPDLGTAQYGAAKFHEAGGLLAVASETENFVHGMNFILEQGDTLLALACNAPGHRRGAQFVGAYRDIVAHAALVGRPAEEGWQEAWLSMMRATVLIQQLCLNVAENRGLPVEEPRAGREQGAQHIGVQGQLMAAI